MMVAYHENKSHEYHNYVFVFNVRLPMNGLLTGQLNAKLIMAFIEVFANECVAIN